MALVGLPRGSVDLVAIRLPSALATLGMTLVIYLYARSWTSRLTAFASAAIYATFGQVLQLGRLGESEALFTFFTGSALLAWHAGYIAARSPAATWSLGYSLAALGALVKGPQAPVYFVGSTCVYLLLVRDWRWLFSRAHLVGIVAFAVVVGAWLVPFALSNAQAVDDIWTGLARDRYTTQGLARHLVSYPIETFGCLLPWSPLLLALLRPRLRRTMLTERPQVKFLLVALAVTYPSLWLAAGARGRYFMPLYPLVAVLIGLVIERFTAESATLGERLFWRRFLRVMAVVGLIGGAVVLAATAKPNLLAAAAQPWALLAAWIPGVLAAVALLIWGSLGERSPRPQVALATLSAFLGLTYAGLVVGARARDANDLAPSVSVLKARISGHELVSLGRVYHRFAYVYGQPIRQITWPRVADDLPSEVTYFCFDRKPGEFVEGAVPFAWDEVARIGCDPTKRADNTNTVVIGRVRRQSVLAGSSVSRPEPR
jgi:4-amino-4-deoxy-L-arabinose transferase-like glycosyltransferase